MDKNIKAAGEKNAGQDDHKSFDWQHVWKSVENAGTQAGNAIKKQVSQIDTQELGDKAKHAASEGLKVARGHSSNKQANEISNVAAQYVPGAGLLRKGAEIAHETGADGKVLEGKKGPLRAPSEKTMRDAGKEAIGTVIPIPGGGMLANEVLNRSGVKDKVIDGAIDAGKNYIKTTDARKPQAAVRGSQSELLPKVVIEDGKQDGVIDAAKEKVGKFFHSFQKQEVKAVKSH